MDDVVSIALLAYAFLLGVKLGSKGRGDLRAAGWTLALLVVPSVVLHVYGTGPVQREFELGGARTTLPRELVTFSTVLLVVQLVAAGMSGLRIRRRGDDFLKFHKALIKVGLLLVLVPLVLQLNHPEIDFTKLLASAAVGSIIVGLALQETLGNLFSGLGVEMENLFRQGEYIQIGEDGPAGTVIEKTWRATRILTYEGQTVYVPNNLLGKELIYNYDRPTPAVARNLEVRASYADPPNLVKETLHQILSSDPDVLENPPIEVWCVKYAESAVEYRARYWVPSWRVHRQIADRVTTAVWYAFRERGIGIPYPVRTVHQVTEEHLAEIEAKREEAVREIALFLARVEPFASHCGVRDRLFLARNAVVERYDPGRNVVVKGEVSDAMFVIRDGDVFVRLPHGGERTLGMGQYFGEIGLLRGERRTADVVAGEHGVTVVRIGRMTLRSVLRARASLGEELDRTGQGRIEELQRLEPVVETPRPRPLTLARALGAGLRLLRPW